MLERKTYFLAQHTPLVIGEIKSTYKESNHFETSNGIKYNLLETIGIVTKVIATDEKTYFILNDMFDNNILVSGMGKHTKDYIKEKIASLEENNMVIVKGTVNVYMKDDEIKYSIYPKSIKLLNYGNEKNSEIREFWYYRLLASRIDNQYPLLKSSDLFPIAETENLKYSEVDGDEDLVIIEATVVKKGPTHISPKKEKKKKISPNPVELPKKKKEKKLEEPPKEEKEESKFDRETVKKMIVVFLKENGQSAVDAIHLELNSKGIGERLAESSLVALITGKKIKFETVDDDETVMLI